MRPAHLRQSNIHLAPHKRSSLKRCYEKVMKVFTKYASNVESKSPQPSVEKSDQEHTSDDKTPNVRGTFQ